MTYLILIILILVDQTYPTELQLNKRNSSDTEAPPLDLNLSITNGIVSSKRYAPFCYVFQFYLLLSPYLCFISLLYLDLYVLGVCLYVLCGHLLGKG